MAGSEAIFRRKIFKNLFRGNINTFREILLMWLTPGSPSDWSIIQFKMKNLQIRLKQQINRFDVWMFQYSDILGVIYQPLYCDWAVPELAPCMLISNIDLQPPPAFPTSSVRCVFFVWKSWVISGATAVFSRLTGGTSLTHVGPACPRERWSDKCLAVTPLPLTDSYLVIGQYSNPCFTTSQHHKHLWKSINLGRTGYQRC